VPLPPRYTHLVGSKFTSVIEVRGWRQFHVIALRKTEDGYHADLRASCDSSIEIRVPAKSLFDRSSWIPGWLLLSDL
jgi:tryptophan-rich hypothetical protein